MKKQLLTAAAVMLSLAGIAQTKGTSALGFRVSSQKTNSDVNGSYSLEDTNMDFALSYGRFIKHNAKLGVQLSFGTGKESTSTTTLSAETKRYGIDVDYQHYFPVFKSLYLYAGGRGGYSHVKESLSGNTPGNNPDNTGNMYRLSANGGLTWFISKRFALETELLSAGGSYYKLNNGQNTNTLEYESFSFDVSTGGLINDMSFKIYFLF
ncbi:outer membrane beta-barrel protein [Pedobacter faecalis]|uniref:outer membrane beta-barrel protein n=1 Tax=Pedobacter faecalis TaxID=3041495 RepID=UPI00254D13FC|nr:outer membrane beta-barrel protein [Pedobacter sp. ELA7]